MKVSLVAPADNEARWTLVERIQIYAVAYPQVTRGADLSRALFEAQQHLGRERQRSLERIQRNVKNPGMREAIQRVRDMTPAQRFHAAQSLQSFVEIRPGDSVAAGGKYGNWWSEVELALVRRRARYWADEMADCRPFHEVVVHAQQVELEPSRWRAAKGIMKALEPHAVDGSGESLVVAFARVEKNPALLDGYPFDPKRYAFTPYECETEPETAQAEAQSSNSLLDNSPPAPEPAPEPPRSLRDMMRAAGYTPPAPEPAPAPPPQAENRPQEPSEPAQATQPLPAFQKTPGDPLAAFAHHLTQGMHALFNAMATHSAAQLATDVRHVAEQLAETIATSLDARIQELVPATVKAALEAQLGPGIEVQPVEVEPLQVDLSGAGLEARIKIDVVGLFPRQATEVRRALNGYADTVRFIEPGKWESWTPRDVVIMSSKVPSKVVEDKCRIAHAQVARAWGTTTSVVNAIRELYAARGIVIPSHH